MLWTCLFLPLTSAGWGSSSGNAEKKYVAWPCTDRSCVTELYNSPVTHAEFVERRLDMTLSGLKPLHEGVKVHLQNGDEYLVHKGEDFGDKSKTVVTPASNMQSGNWKTVMSADVNGKTVNDFVKHANPETDYNPFTDNCQHAACNTWKKNIEDP